MFNPKSTISECSSWWKFFLYFANCFQRCSSCSTQTLRVALSENQQRNESPKIIFTELFLMFVSNRCRSCSKASYFLPGTLELLPIEAIKFAPCAEKAIQIWTVYLIAKLWNVDPLHFNLTFTIILRLNPHASYVQNNKIWMCYLILTFAPYE